MGGIKCCDCGRFIPHHDMQNGAAHFHFIPDNEFGPEVSEWECASCVEKENLLRKRLQDVRL